ncbi:hypothetical protein D3C75_640490 [compost metagenome]
MKDEEDISANYEEFRRVPSLTRNALNLTLLLKNSSALIAVSSVSLETQRNGILITVRSSSLVRSRKLLAHTVGSQVIKLLCIAGTLISAS